MLFSATVLFPLRINKALLIDGVGEQMMVRLMNRLKQSNPLERPKAILPLLLLVVYNFSFP